MRRYREDNPDDAIPQLQSGAFVVQQINRQATFGLFRWYQVGGTDSAMFTLTEDPQAPNYAATWHQPGICKVGTTTIEEWLRQALRAMHNEEGTELAVLISLFPPEFQPIIQIIHDRLVEQSIRALLEPKSDTTPWDQVPLFDSFPQK